MTRAWRSALLVLLLSFVPSTARAPERPVDSPLAPVEIWAEGFQDLRGIAIDGTANVYVADREEGTITRIAPDRRRTVVASRLERPIGLAFDTTGHLLVTEERAGRVVRFEANGARTLLVSRLKQPRWLAVDEQGRLFISARRFTAKTEPEPDDESATPQMILVLLPTGQLRVFADGFRDLQGLAAGGGALYAVARGQDSDREEGGESDDHEKGGQNPDHGRGAVFEIPILSDGSAGPPTLVGPPDRLKRPTGLALDRLSALFVTAKALDAGRDRSHRSKGVIAKLTLEGTLTRFASMLKKPQGLAFDADGNLYVADGEAGRVLRFRAPPAPTLTGLPQYTNQSPLTVTGTTQPNARIALFVNDAVTPLVANANAAGVFSLGVPLALNASNTLEVFATAAAGLGLTGASAQATVTHDTIPPGLIFQTPPAGSYLRQTVSVQAQASDGGSGVANLVLAAAGRGLSAALVPVPPAPAVTATAQWDTRTASDGAETIRATASDRAGNSTTGTRGVIVDNTPPDTLITDGPAAEISDTSATFTFTGTDNLTPQADLVFAWRLDGGAFTPFSSSTTATVTSLTEGQHTFEVKARDLAGNEDPTPAARTFTVSFGPSITSIDPPSGPVGTFVTVTGTNFESGKTQVTFNSAPAILRTVTATAITTTVPLSATTGPLTATTPRGTASRTFTVTTTGDFTLAAAPAPPVTLRVIAGDLGSASILAGGSGTFTSLVGLSMSAGPPGVTPTLSSQFLAPGATTFVTFTVAKTVPLGAYDFTVTGQAQVDAQMLTRTASLTLEVLPPDTLAVTGRVLTADAVPQPIPGATITLGSAFTLTDAAGNFVLLAPPAGANMLLVDGRTASTPVAQYPPVEINIAVNASGPTRVPFVVFLPKLDTSNPITLPLDAAGFTTTEVKATTPTIPGLVVTIPAGTRITGPDGNPVSQITITPVPIDRSPMPFPAGVTFPMLFTIQPGGAVPSHPLPITFPNIQQAPPGTPADLYFFDLAIGTWAIWGTGTVSPDGTSIVSDPGFGLPRFAWHAPVTRSFNPIGPRDNVRCDLARCGDRVDVVTGRFTVRKTDLVLSGRLPVTVQRTYRSENSQAGPLGVGWNLTPYDSRLSISGASLLLILADQRSYLLAPTGPGRWMNVTESFLQGAVATQMPGPFDFQIRFKDGTVHRYNRIANFTNLAGLSAISDRNGNTVTISRESGLTTGQFGQITRITGPSGKAAVFTYDGGGRIESITDPIGRAVRYSYDAQGRLETATDPTSGMTQYTYDATGRILNETDPHNVISVTSEYDSQGRVQRQVEADGGVWTFSYPIDPQFTVTNPDQARILASTAFALSDIVVTDPLGNRTGYRIDGRGVVLSVTDGFGQTTAFSYIPGSNLPESITDPLGRVTRFDYDNAGNVIRSTDAAGGMRTFAYEPTFNKVTSIIDESGNRTQFSYDTSGNLTKITDARGARSVAEYDTAGQLIAVSDAAGNRRSFSYDADGNLATTTDALQNVTKREYDSSGRLIRETDPLGHATLIAYDSFDQVIAIADAFGGVRHFAYDSLGNPLSVTDERGNITTHSYDARGRLVTRTDPNGAVERFEYDLMGNLIRYTDRNGQVATLAYDALNRRSAATYGDGRTTSFRYDTVGRILQISESVGSSVWYRYDGLGRVVAEVTEVGALAYQYDALGRRTRMDLSGEAPVRYAYDSASRLTQIVQGDQVVSVDYDALGRRTRVTLPNQLSTEYKYDAISRLTAVLYRNAFGPLGDLAYEYDRAGNRVAVNGSFARTALPDAVAAAAYGSGNIQLRRADQVMAYDGNGNTTSITAPDGVTTLRWDARNRVIAITAPGVMASFGYDGLGRRIIKTVNGLTTRYLYDGIDIVQELGPERSVTYLRGLNIDEPYVRGGSEFYLADASGSIVGLTDSTGRIQTEYSYEAFGRSVAGGQLTTNRVQFTGREFDETGFYHFRARVYDPGRGRFLQQDPIGFGSGDTNLYAYVRNNPVRFVDPTGLAIWECRRAQIPGPALFRHDYLWNDEGVRGKRSCGSLDKFGTPEYKEEIGPDPGTHVDWSGEHMGRFVRCKKIIGSESSAASLMDCCRRRTKPGAGFFPFLKDCFDVVASCLDAARLDRPDFGIGGDRLFMRRCDTQVGCVPGLVLWQFGQ